MRRGVDESLAVGRTVLRGRHGVSPRCLPHGSSRPRQPRSRPVYAVAEPSAMAPTHSARCLDSTTRGAKNVARIHVRATSRLTSWALIDPSPERAEVSDIVEAPRTTGPVRSARRHASCAVHSSVPAICFWLLSAIWTLSSAGCRFSPPIARSRRLSFVVRADGGATLQGVSRVGCGDGSLAELG